MHYIINFLLIILLISCQPFATESENMAIRALTYMGSAPEPVIAKTTYQIKGQLKDSNGDAVRSASLNAAGLSTSLSIYGQIQDNGTTFVSAAPDKLSFVDVDPRKGYLAGSIRIKKASDESALSHYNLYWCDTNQNKIKRIAKLNKTGLDYVYVFPLGTEAPENATGFLAVSGNDSGDFPNPTAKTIIDTEFQFFTNDSGEYIMGLTPGKYTIGIVSSDGFELGSMILELPETLDSSNPPTPVPIDGDMTMTISAIGPEGSTPTAIELSTDKTFSSFSFSGALATIIDGSNITATLPYGSDVTSLIANFSTSGKQVMVNGLVQTSGSDSQDFSNPVTYTIMAADGSRQDYIVVVTVQENYVPSATTPIISGTVAPGQTLTASYTFSDANNHVEGNSSRQWYRCSDNTDFNNCTAITNATSLSYTIVEANDETYYLRFAVTPTDSYGLSGTMAYSTATTQIMKAPVPGNSGNMIATPTANTSNVTFSWTAANDGKTGQADLSYSVYKSTTNDIATVSQMLAASSKRILGPTNNLTTTSAIAESSFYINVLVSDSAGNYSAYNGKQRKDVWVGGLASLPADKTYENGNWTEVTNNCMTTGGGGACMKSATTTNSLLKFTIELAQPGAVFFTGKGNGNSTDCVLRVENSTTSVTSSINFFNDDLYSIQVDKGNNTFIWQYVGTGGNACFIDRIRY